MHPNFFSENSPFLNHPLLTPERTAAEIDFVLAHVPVLAHRFLDVGCGFGRHSLELAQRGYWALGIDPAAAMIAAANERKSKLEPEARPNVEFEVTSGETYKAPDGNPFDVALCLMTTLGQVGPNGENDGLLKAIHQNLIPNGTLILEVPQKQAVIDTLKAADHFGSDTHYTAIERTFDSKTERIVERFNIVSPESAQNYLLSYRLFSQAEVAQRLTAAGFNIRSVFANFSAAPLSTQSMNMLFVCEAKPGVHG